MTNLDVLAERAGCTVQSHWDEIEFARIYTITDERGRVVGGAAMPLDEAADELRLRAHRTA